MMEERKAVEEGFYQEVAEVFGTSSTYVQRGPYWRRTRWTNREPGSGRFPGFGTVRMFSASYIHVCLNHPVAVSKVFTCRQETLDYLKKLLTRHSSSRSESTPPAIG